MRLASQRDFQGGPVYTSYPPPEVVYVKRARLLGGYPEPLLVVGCGFGGLVQALHNLKLEAWGIDASPYAIGNRVSKWVEYGNILDLSECSRGPYGTVITEDLLPHLSDEEVIVAARNCQALSPIVIHMVTEAGQADLNYRSCVDVMRMTNQLCISLEGM